VKYERKKAPLKPDWQSSFDAHLYPGRTFEMIVMQRPEQKVGEVTVTAQALSDHCKSTNDIASVWVNTSVPVRPTALLQNISVDLFMHLADT